jgi:hypothetical protein
VNGNGNLQGLSVADPKRLLTLKTITEWLANEVSIANGYEHDLGGNQPRRVYRGRSVFSDSQPLPCIALLEGLNPDTDARPPNAAQDIQINKWHLLVQGWVIDDEENPTDPAYRLAADVQKALAKLMPTLTQPGGPVINAYLEAPVVRPPDDVSSRAYFWLRFVLTVKDNSRDPYLLT